MLRHRFENEAEEELRDAAAWYEAERKGLGCAFLTRAQEVTDLLRRFPEIGAPAPRVDPDLGVRKFSLGRFPYRLVYLVADEELVVLAVAHEHRRPGYWQERLGRL